LGVKRTSLIAAVMSANDPKRTSLRLLSLSITQPQTEKFQIQPCQWQQIGTNGDQSNAGFVDYGQSFAQKNHSKDC
jgi:hypothetical protein